MKKLTKKIKNQTGSELEKEIVKMRNDIAKQRLNMKVNPPKDINALYKKRKALAVYLTVLSERKESTQLEKSK